jgi:opacity protein-like surface antigen
MTFSAMLRFGLIFVLASHILANSSSCVGQEPRFPSVGPTVSVTIGYAYLNSEVPTAGRINENGVVFGVSTDFNRRFGIKVEASYTRAYGAFGIDHHSDVLTYLGGPIFYPVRCRRFSIYTHALIGAARITGVIPESNGTFLLGETNKLAWAIGPGVDTRLSRSTVLRVGADYLHSSYFAPNKAIQSQGNVRVIMSLVYTLGKIR